MEIHVVNLVRRADRRARFLAWNQRTGLTFNFFQAIDGKSLSRDALLRDGVVADDHERLKDGALGNALSHRTLWRQAIAANAPRVICEDDCCLRADFADAMPQLMARLPSGWDVVFFGYNTNGSLAVETGEGLKAVLIFDESHKAASGFFDRYAANPQSLAPSTLLRCFQRWGTMCYAVSPAGAAKLDRFVFPITGAQKLVMFGQNRTISPYGMDSMICLALQREDIASYCAFPPLAMVENDTQDSDVFR